MDFLNFIYTCKGEQPHTKQTSPTPRHSFPMCMPQPVTFGLGKTQWGQHELEIKVYCLLSAPQLKLWDLNWLEASWNESSLKKGSSDSFSLIWQIIPFHPLVTKEVIQVGGGQSCETTETGGHTVKELTYYVDKYRCLPETSSLQWFFKTADSDCFPSSGHSCTERYLLVNVWPPTSHSLWQLG